jgi:hypothetical protein
LAFGFNLPDGSFMLIRIYQNAGGTAAVTIGTLFWDGSEFSPQFTAECHAACAQALYGGCYQMFTAGWANKGGQGRIASTFSTVRERRVCRREVGCSMLAYIHPQTNEKH